MSEVQHLNSQNYKFRFSRINSKISREEAARAINELIGDEVEDLEISVDRRGDTNAKFEKRYTEKEAEDLISNFLTDEYYDGGILGLINISIEELQTTFINEPTEYNNKYEQQETVFLESKLMKKLEENKDRIMIGFIFIFFLIFVLAVAQLFAALQSKNQYVPPSVSSPNYAQGENGKSGENEKNKKQKIRKIHQEQIYGFEKEEGETSAGMVLGEDIALQKSQNLPIVAPLNSKINVMKKSEKTFEFEYKLRKYDVEWSMKDKVIDHKKTAMEKYEYIRPTNCFVYKFPKSEWVSDAKEKISYEVLDSQTERESFTDSLYYSKSSKKRLDFAFFRSIVQNLDKKKYEEAEYYNLNKKYHLDQVTEELPLCVIGTGRNLVNLGLYDRFLSSLNRQNYTNFKVVFIDDASIDDTALIMFAKVSSDYPRLKSRITFISNEERIGAFANKDSGVKENCDQNSIVVSLDGDDGLIGRQVFNVINQVYQRQSKPWVVYTNFIEINIKNKLIRGENKKLEVSTSEYRHSNLDFAAGHLITYMAFLQMKIPYTHLTEVAKVNGNEIRRYPTYSSDSTIMFSLLELAGNERVIHLADLFYWHKGFLDKENDCLLANKRYDELKMRDLAPLEMLKNEKESAKVREGSFKGIEKLEEAKNKFFNECHS